MDATARGRSAALYLDFDNVFAALAATDEWAAWDFAMAPSRWLASLGGGEAGAGPARRILIRRCYLNPAGWHENAPRGWMAAQTGHPRVFYSRFRAEFVRAGFQVVDCPRLARLKNAADIVMALDIADALAHPTRFDEFILLSADSDFTPLLHRLRAHDRRSLLVAGGTGAEALRNTADSVLALEDLAESAASADGLARRAFLPARPGPPPPPDGSARPAAAGDVRAPPSPGPDPSPPDRSAQRAAILAVVRDVLAEADRPVHLPALGTGIHKRLGDWVRKSRFGGARTLAKLIEEAPDLALEPGPGGGWLYDPARHDRPSLAQPDVAYDAAALAPAPLGAAAWEGLAVPRLGPEALDFALRGLAGLIPVPDPGGPPGQDARAALAGEAAAAGLDLPRPELDSLVSWLDRAGVDWSAASANGSRHDRLAHAFLAEVVSRAEADGALLAPEAMAELRAWTGVPHADDAVEGEDDAADFTPQAESQALP